jgi:hypothetical protein
MSQINDLQTPKPQKSNKITDFEVRALARLEGWPQAHALNTILRGSPKMASTSG